MSRCPFAHEFGWNYGSTVDCDVCEPKDKVPCSERYRDVCCIEDREEQDREKRRKFTGTEPPEVKTR